MRNGRKQEGGLLSAKNAIGYEDSDGQTPLGFS